MLRDISKLEVGGEYYFIDLDIMLPITRKFIGFSSYRDVLYFEDKSNNCMGVFSIKCSNGIIKTNEINNAVFTSFEDAKDTFQDYLKWVVEKLNDMLVVPLFSRYLENN